MVSMEADMQYKLIILTMMLHVVAFNTQASVETLKGVEGYVLIELEVGGVSPAIKIAPVRFSGDSHVEVELSQITDRFYLLKLRKGDYVVKEISSPLYNLPYSIDTEKGKHWRFNVKEKQTTYFGKLVIKGERSKKSVVVRRENNIASTLKEIQANYPEILSQYPLYVSMGYRDDFYSDYMDIKAE